MRERVGGLPASVRHLVGMHFGWWDREGRPVESTAGKMIRPALVFGSCAAMGGEATDALAAGAAVELVHNASLLHDDIIDGDLHRRGRTALWAEMGVPAGILAGDALFFLAVDVLARAGAPFATEGVTRMVATVHDLIHGEHMDVLMEQRVEASVNACLDVARHKTASLLALSCALGAMAAKADACQITCMSEYGGHLGQAFQIVDDVLGIWGDAKVTGKPVGSDLTSGKKSLPVAYALSSGTQAADALREMYTEHEKIPAEQVERAMCLLQEAGARTWAVQETHRHVRYAKERLRYARPEPVAHEELVRLLEMVAVREK
ncbi:polyprenyl synthetase family protein [Streptomyces mobaraensis]|uniref:polyprenyl synthetase family protein n=1 Tax=Streptomyces mobaraensis TaxID=35621 RepID=UPI00332F594A